MAEVIKMPHMSDTMEEGVIVEWHKKVGDKVESGDILADVETDKATMELESYQEGTLLYIGAKEGEAVPVESVIAILGEEGEDYKKLLKEIEDEQKGKKKEEPEEGKEEKGREEEEEKTKAKEEKEEEPEKKEEEPKEKIATDGRLKASPLAKRIADEEGVDISKVKGSGDDGRIIKRDIEKYIEEGGAEVAKGLPEIKIPEFVGEEKYEEKNVSQMRKTIAKRLAESKYSAPHFYLTSEINMDRVVEAREKLNEIAQIKISYNDIVIKAAAAALRQHPQVNAAWKGDKIRYNKHIHIGMAVAVEEGLIVPVIRFADNKTLTQIAAESKNFAQRAKDKKLQPEDWEGNTFSVSNLGMFDIDEFTAIINPPDACILAIGSIKQVPAVIDGEIKPTHIMKVTLSCDHRVVDGATGARFLQTLKSYLEEPLRILI